MLWQPPAPACLLAVPAQAQPALTRAAAAAPAAAQAQAGQRWSPAAATPGTRAACWWGPTTPPPPRSISWRCSSRPFDPRNDRPASWAGQQQFGMNTMGSTCTTCCGRRIRGIQAAAGPFLTIAEGHGTGRCWSCSTAAGTPPHAGAAHRPIPACTTPAGCRAPPPRPIIDPRSDATFSRLRRGVVGPSPTTGGCSPGTSERARQSRGGSYKRRRAEGGARRHRAAAAQTFPPGAARNGRPAVTSACGSDRTGSPRASTLNEIQPPAGRVRRITFHNYDQPEQFEPASRSFGPTAGR